MAARPMRRRRMTEGGSRKSRRARFSVIGSDVDYVNHVVATVDLPLGFDRRPAPSRRHTVSASARRRSRASRAVAAADFRGAPTDDDDATALRQRRKTAFAALGRVREDEPQVKLGDIATAPPPKTAAKLPESDNEEDGSDSEDEDETSSSSAFALTFALLVASGVGANVAFERLNVLDPGCGQVFTLLQYVATVAEKSPDASAFLRKPAIPPTVHAACVALMFATAAWGNACLSHDLNFATYLIIKNCNLVFSMVVGAVFLGRRYRWGQVASVVLVSFGVICSVLSQRKEKALAETAGDATTGVSDGLVGAALCAASTLSMACLGCLQEHAFARYGGNKDDDEAAADGGVDAPAEALFYTHLLGLPLFLAPGGGLGSHARALTALWRRAVPLGLFNVVCVVTCKRCFFELLDRSSSLTATLAITVYRFVGIVVSACGLARGDGGDGGPGTAVVDVPPAGFWAGAVSVGVGSVSYLFSSDRGKTGTSSGSGSASSSSSARRKRN